MKINQYQIENKASYKNRTLNIILKNILMYGVNNETMNEANTFVMKLNNEYQAVNKRINNSKLSLLINLNLAYQPQFKIANRINNLYFDIQDCFLKEVLEDD